MLPCQQARLLLARYNAEKRGNIEGAVTAGREVAMVGAGADAGQPAPDTSTLSTWGDSRGECACPLHPSPPLFLCCSAAVEREMEMKRTDGEERK